MKPAIPLAIAASVIAVSSQRSLNFSAGSHCLRHLSAICPPPDKHVTPHDAPDHERHEK